MALFKLGDPWMELMRFAGKWLAHSAMAGRDGETLIPFGVSQRKSWIGRTEDIQIFQAPTFEQGAEAASQWFGTTRGTCLRAMFGFDGYATIGGIKRDAIIAYAADGNGEAEVKMTAPYRRGGVPGDYESYQPILTLSDNGEVDPDRYAQLMSALRAGRDMHPIKEVRQVARWTPMSNF
ncbi:hypothetical protein [Labrys monachus]|uniref:DUF1579 domain-containing protein n=1 Tax=Labrys monachus TaxID=217067 RepID=A0ABU0FDY3_9HYPH|nr:hypothetical protein [Labrys monachus]MDQ0392641.1 hypothetical protein [Labrys monachus]